MENAIKEKKVFKRVLWSINDLSQPMIEQYAIGKRIKSTDFIVCFNGMETIWYLTLFPNGNFEGNKSNLSLFLRLKESKHTSFEVKFKLGIKSKDEVGFMRSERQKSSDVMEAVGGWGFPTLLKHQEFFDPAKRLFLNNSLSIICELTLEAKQKAALCKHDRLIADYKIMFDNQILSDFRLKTKDGKILKAHKAILVARSPMFYAMLISNMQEPTEDFANISDYDSIIMKEVLRFIYYNDVEDLQGIAHDLVFAAEKYHVKYLKELCLDTLIASLSIENALKLLMIADRLSNASELFNESVKVIKGNLKVLRNTSEWKNLSNELLLNIVDQAFGESDDTIYI